MSISFWRERIVKTKEIIVAYEDAIIALAGSGGIQSYTLDTGQSRQTVTRYDLDRMNEELDALYNRLATLEARLNGSGVLTVRPCW